jgi:hypothetical protein
VGPPFASAARALLYTHRMTTSCYTEAARIYRDLDRIYDELGELMGKPELYEGRPLGLTVLTSRQAVRLALTLVEDLRDNLVPPPPPEVTPVASLRPSQSPLTP